MRVRRVVAVALAALLAAVGLAPTAPAAAATADRWGFAYVDNPTVTSWTVLDTTRQWGTWKTAFPAAWADGINSPRAGSRCGSRRSAPVRAGCRT